MNQPNRFPFFVSAIGLLGASSCAAPPPCPQAPAPLAMPAPAPAPPAVAPVVQVSAEPAPPTPALLGALPELPRPSPNAAVKQVVGITNVSLEYSSPAVKGRQVWGELVPFGKVWRAGANSPTKLTVSRDFTFGDKAVPAGSYSLFIIPTDTTWTFILNRDPKGAGAFDHVVAMDVARADAPTISAPPRERLAFLFEDTTDSSTRLVLDWGGKRGSVPITVATDAHVDESIKTTLANAWRPLFNAGRYAFDKGDNARALELLNQSIGVQASWWNHWWAAQVLAKQNQYAAAREHANKAIALGEKDAVFQRSFAEQVKKAVASWPQS